MSFRRLLSFFLRRPFPRELSLLLLNADQGATVYDLREWARKTRSETGCWLVGGLGHSFFADRGLVAPRGLKPMPAFPFDADTVDPRSAEALVAVLTDSDAVALPGAGAALAPGWTVCSARRGRRDPSRRNHLGFVDGSSNMLELDERPTLERAVVREDGSTLLVYREIHLDQKLWESLTAEEQEAVFGTQKADGRPLGDADRRGQPSYTFDPLGTYTPLSSHGRKAYPRRPLDPVTMVSDRHHRIFRWGFNHAERPGLLFMCMQRNLEDGFETVYGRWMCGDHSPSFSAGPDRLLQCGVMSTVAGAYVYVPASGVLHAEEPVADWMYEHA